MLCWVQHMPLLWNFTQSPNSFSADEEMMFPSHYLFKFSLFIHMCSKKTMICRKLYNLWAKCLILHYINLINLGWEVLTLVCCFRGQALWKCSSHSVVSMISLWRARKPRAWHTPGMEQSIHSSTTRYSQSFPMRTQVGSSPDDLTIPTSRWKLPALTSSVQMNK